MQNNLLKKFVFVVVMTVSCFAWAGVREVGNGGVGFTCPNQPGVAHLFDLYEGEALQNLKPIPSQLDFKQQALGFEKQLNEVTGLFGDDGSFGNRIEQVLSIMKFIRPDSSLVLTNDLNNFIYPTGCTMVQILNYHNDGFIYIDGKYWNQLSETEKAAATLHEAVYSYLRDATNINFFANGDSDSTRTRRVVYTLMAGIKLTKVTDFDNQPSGSQQFYCHTPEARAANRPTTEFVMFVSPGGTNTHVYFQSLTGRLMLTKSTIDMQGSIHDKAIMGSIVSLVDWDIRILLSALREGSDGMTNIVIYEGGNRTSEAVKCARLIDRP